MNFFKPINRFYRRLLCSSEEAQASAVGTMFALIIIIIIISIITLYYVPVWMEGQEAEHMRKVESEFMRLRDTVQAQISNSDTSKRSTSIDLGTEGMPILAIGTSGRLLIEPYESMINVSNGAKKLNFTSSGRISFRPKNRYYPEQNFIYEGGAIIIAQPRGEVMKATPQFKFNGGKVTFTMLAFEGDMDSITGQSTWDVSTTLSFVAPQTYSWGSENLTINVTTNYVDAWQTYFSNYLNQSAPNAYAVEVNKDKGYVCVSINGNKITQVTVRYAVLEVKLEHV